MAKNDAKAVAKFLGREVIPQFGIPDKISSDNGSHSVNAVIKGVTEVVCINHKLGCV